MKYRQISLILIPFVSAFQHPAGSARIALTSKEKTHVLTSFENSFSNVENIIRSKRNSALNLYQDFGSDDIDELNDGDTFRFSKDDLKRIQQQYERYVYVSCQMLCSHLGIDLCRLQKLFSLHLATGYTAYCPNLLQLL